MTVVPSYNQLLQFPTKQLPFSPITRFAPSPTGHLHLGHLLSLIYVHAATKLSKGTLLLRIEDHDRQRRRELFITSIKEDIAWLGIEGEWMVQSEREALHETTLQMLIDSGDAYYCTCTRKQIQLDTGNIDQELCYTGRCRGRHNIPEGEYGIRLQLPDTTVTFNDLLCGKQEQKPSQQCGDLLLRDRHGNFTYNFCVVVDDIADHVNFIVRGADLLHCTGRQQLLKKRLGNSKEITYAHHPLILEKGGEKLSKRNRSTTLRSQREKGILPEELIGKALANVGILPKERAVFLEESIFLLQQNIDNLRVCP